MTDPTGADRTNPQDLPHGGTSAPTRRNRKPLRWSEAELAQLDAMYKRLRARAAELRAEPLDHAS